MPGVIREFIKSVKENHFDYFGYTVNVVHFAEVNWKKKSYSGPLPTKILVAYKAND